MKWLHSFIRGRPTWQAHVNGNLCFYSTLNKDAWQSVSRGAGVMLFWRESQCKNVKVNKEWLLLRNMQRERACKAGSVVQDRESRWASFSSAKAQWVCEDTCWRPSMTSTNRWLEWFSSYFSLGINCQIVKIVQHFSVCKDIVTHDKYSYYYSCETATARNSSGKFNSSFSQTNGIIKEYDYSLLYRESNTT